MKGVLEREINFRRVGSMGFSRRRRCRRGEYGLERIPASFRRGIKEKRTRCKEQKAWSCSTARIQVCCLPGFVDDSPWRRGEDKGSGEDKKEPLKKGEETGEMRTSSWLRELLFSAYEKKKNC